MKSGEKTLLQRIKRSLVMLLKCNIPIKKTLILVSNLAALFLMCAKAGKHDLSEKVEIDFSQMIIKTDDSIVLCWDGPNHELELKKHVLFYSTRNDMKWHPIDTIEPTSEPKAVIYRHQILSNDSIFYFGVKSAGDGLVESEIHACYDIDASPSGGWLLFWKNK